MSRGTDVAVEQTETVWTGRNLASDRAIVTTRQQRNGKGTQAVSGRLYRVLTNVLPPSSVSLMLSVLPHSGRGKFKGPLPRAGKKHAEHSASTKDFVLFKDSNEKPERNALGRAAKAGLSTGIASTRRTEYLNLGSRWA